LQTFYVDWKTEEITDMKPGMRDNVKNETNVKMIQLSSLANVPNSVSQDENLSDSLSNISNQYRSQMEISQWRRITFSSGNYIFVYSAFFDDRLSTPVVRLNVVAPLRFNRKHDRTRCLVEMRDGEIISTTSQLEVQREHFSLPWASHFIICDVNGRTVAIFSFLHK
jgi:hypothetical protein